jgi:hypothetical protein
MILISPFGLALQSADLGQPVAPPSTATGWFYLSAGA